MKQNERFSSIEEFEILPVPTNSKNCLGVGSFGSVKLAKHKHSLIKYALKIVFYFFIIYIINFLGEFERIRVRSRSSKYSKRNKSAFKIRSPIYYKIL